jgi:hypothetical protein
MSRGPHTFKQRDVMRMIKAITKAGEQVARVEFDPDGRKFAIVTANGTPPETEIQPEREIDL